MGLSVASEQSGDVFRARCLLNPPSSCFLVFFLTMLSLLHGLYDISRRLFVIDGVEGIWKCSLLF